MTIQTLSDPFAPPTDLNTRVWRYMSFAQFVALCQQKYLFLAPVAKLDDPSEGTYPVAVWLAQDGVLEFTGQEFLKHFAPKYYKAKTPESLKRAVRQYGARLDWSANCWHVSDVQSFAMWELYGGPDGVAIQSTYAKLQDAIQAAPHPERYSLAQVQYLDYTQLDIDAAYTQSDYWKDNRMPFVCKRIEYAYERELRILGDSRDKWSKIRKIVTEKSIKSGDKITETVDQITVSSGPSASFSWKRDGSLKLPVNLSELIEQVFVPSQSPKWVRDLATDIVQTVAPDLRVKQPIANPSVRFEPKSD